MQDHDGWLTVKRDAYDKMLQELGELRYQVVVLRRQDEERQAQMDVVVRENEELRRGNSQSVLY